MKNLQLIAGVINGIKEITTSRDAARDNLKSKTTFAAPFAAGGTYYALPELLPTIFAALPPELQPPVEYHEMIRIGLSGLIALYLFFYRRKKA